MISTYSMKHMTNSSQLGKSIQRIQRNKEQGAGQAPNCRGTKLCHVPCSTSYQWQYNSPLLVVRGGGRSAWFFHNNNNNNNNNVENKRCYPNRTILANLVTQENANEQTLLRAWFVRTGSSMRSFRKPTPSFAAGQANSNRRMMMMRMMMMMMMMMMKKMITIIITIINYY